MLKWPCPVLRLHFQPVQHFKRLLARLFNDRVSLRCPIKNLMIFGIDSVVFAYYDIYVQVRVDQLFCGVCIIGVW